MQPEGCNRAQWEVWYLCTQPATRRLPLLRCWRPHGCIPSVWQEWSHLPQLHCSWCRKRGGCQHWHVPRQSVWSRGKAAVATGAHLGTLWEYTHSMQCPHLVQRRAHGVPNGCTRIAVVGYPAPNYKMWSKGKVAHSHMLMCTPAYCCYLLVSPAALAERGVLCYWWRAVLLLYWLHLHTRQQREG